jgi:CarD family transcriptional regulator
VSGGFGGGEASSVFEIGEAVMHPVHGAGVIRDISCESLSGEPMDYYVIEMLADDIKLFVPVERAGEIGLRRAAGPEGVKGLVEVVSGPAGALPSDFRERSVLLRSIVSGEDPVRKAEALRDLGWRSWEQRLPLGDRRAFDRLRHELAGEISVALGMGFDEALELLEDSMKRSVSETRKRDTGE